MNPIGARARKKRQDKALAFVYIAGLGFACPIANTSQNIQYSIQLLKMMWLL